MSEHNHTGLDEAASVASNTMQAVRTGKAISVAAKGAAAGGPYGAAIGAALSARKHIGKIAAVALVLLALPLLFILLLPGIIFGSLTDSGASGAAGQPILNDNAAITENVNQAAFAINQILGEGIENVQERIANDFAGTGGDHYEVVNPYEGISSAMPTCLFLNTARRKNWTLPPSPLPTWRRSCVRASRTFTASAERWRCVLSLRRRTARKIHWKHGTSTRSAIMVKPTLRTPSLR